MRKQIKKAAAKTVERIAGGRPNVVVMFDKDHALLKMRVVALVRKLGWRPLDLEFYPGALPPYDLQGALIKCWPDDPVVGKLRKCGCRVVRFGSVFYETTDVPVVVEDQQAAGRLAAEHFAERNFRHVGFIGYGDMHIVRPLYEAFRSRAVDLGCECHLLVFRQLTLRETRLSWNDKTRLRDAEMKEWLRKVPKPLGLLGFSDGLAGRMCVAAIEAGLKVPGEVAVLGHGNQESICESAPVRLSSVDPDFDRYAESGVRLLQDLMDGKPAPDGPVLVPPSGVAVRESTDVLAASDPAVIRALHYIWENISRPMSVDDIASAVSVQRRKLERCFHDQLGRGINAELRRRRLERCCELLRTTNISVTDLASMMGFTNKDYFHALFRREYGVTPRKYRMREKGAGEKAEG